MRLAILLCLLGFPASLSAQAAFGSDWEAYVRRGMHDWRVPGLSVAIVHGDSVRLAGYGVRRLGAAEQVDARTVFAVGSVTKALTAALVAMLVDEGGVRWDDPVAEHLPGFRLADPYVTGELSLRDALAHRSGLPPTDMVWHGGVRTREEVVRRLRFVRPTRGFRTSFSYQNTLYVAAGEVVRARTGGSPWDDVLRARLLDPLGMHDVATSVRALATRPNVARPHLVVGDSVRPIPYLMADNVAAAGGLNASASDLARWIRFQLDSGRVEERRLLSRGAFLETRRPQIVLPPTRSSAMFAPEQRLRAYALGWFLDEYRGREVVWHPGSMDGMSALVALLPGERFGVAVLANLQGTELPRALAYRAFDELLGPPGMGSARISDWSALLLAERNRSMERGKAFEARAARARVPGTRPTLPLERYVGTYVDSLHGEVRVTLADGMLVTDAENGLRGTLSHWHYDTFRTRWDGLLQEGDAFAEFSVDRTGVPTRLSLDLEGPVQLVRAP